MSCKHEDVVVDYFDTEGEGKYAVDLRCVDCGMEWVGEVVDLDA